MNRARIAGTHKLPKVFVACPYDEAKFGFSRYKMELQMLPWTCLYANTTLHTKHLLEKIKALINEADFSLFDLSMWNPNVALELGLAEGLSCKYKSYFILTNARLSRDVPSDIKGIQRIEYGRLSEGASSLRAQLVEHFFKVRFHPTRLLWKELSGQEDGERRFVLGLQVLAYLRDHTTISVTACQQLAKRLKLPEKCWREVCDAMWNDALLVEMRGGVGYRLYNARLYKRPTQ